MYFFKTYFTCISYIWTKICTVHIYIVVVQLQSYVNSLRPHGLQHARRPSPSLSPRVCSNSCPLNQWCHPTISYSVIPFSSYLKSFPASGSFQWFDSASGGQSIGASASASFLLVTIQGWFLLGLIGWISLLSKGLSRVFSSTTIWKHQFFGAQPSLKPVVIYKCLIIQKDCLGCYQEAWLGMKNEELGGGASDFI